MSVKINVLELENVKKIKALKMELRPDGLTVIGGKNRAGKSTALDAICWTLGGETFRPSQPDNLETGAKAKTKITLSNGLVVERFGKNGSLKVTAPGGLKGSQTLLNAFISTFALNLPEFMNANSKTKADILLRIIGVGDKLERLEAQEKEHYDEKAIIKKELTRLEANYEKMPYHADIPEEIPDLNQLRASLKKAEEFNNTLQSAVEEVNKISGEMKEKQDTINRLEVEFRDLAMKKARLMERYHDVIPLDLSEYENAITERENMGEKIQENRNRQQAAAEIEKTKQEYETEFRKLDAVRAEKAGLLKNVELPLPGLSIEEGELIYNGQKWDCMSGAEKLIVSTAISRRINPECGFVLIDDAERFDIDQLADFAAWATEEDLQIIATRVSTGDECTVIIEDGEVVEK